MRSSVLKAFKQVFWEWNFKSWEMKRARIPKDKTLCFFKRTTRLLHGAGGNLCFLPPLPSRYWIWRSWCLFQSSLPVVKIQIIPVKVNISKRVTDVNGLAGIVPWVGQALSSMVSVWERALGSAGQAGLGCRIKLFGSLNTQFIWRRQRQSPRMNPAPAVFQASPSKGLLAASTHHL